MTDEWFTWDFLSLHTSLLQVTLSGIFSPNNSLYYPFAKLTSDLLGTISVYSIRLPAAIFGMLAIPLSYIVGREYKNEITGILLSGFVTLSFPFIYYSQNARSYTIVILTFLIFTLLLIRFLRGDTTPKTTIMLCMSGILCIYAHPYAVIPVAISCVLVMYYNGKAIWKYAVATLAIAAPAIYYNRNYIPSIFLSKVTKQYGSQFWVTWDQLGVMIPSELFGMIWVIVIPLCAYSLYKKREIVKVSLTTIGLLTILSCLPMALILDMSPRYALLVSPLLFLIAIEPVSDLIERHNGDLQKITLLLICLFTFWVFAYGSWVSWTTFNICPLMTMAN